MQFLVDRIEDTSSVRDIFGKTPLHYAAAIGNFEAAQILLPTFKNTGAKDCQGLTAGNCALMEGHKKVAELIVAHSRILESLK